VLPPGLANGNLHHCAAVTGFRVTIGTSTTIHTAMNPLTPAERRALKARAHHLQPVVLIGEAGVTPAVLGEIDRALTSHELIKVRVPGESRAQRSELAEGICTQLDAATVQGIGRILVIFRPRPAEMADKATNSKRSTNKGSARRGAPRRTKRSFQMS
jgi:RNA-binding protein